MLFTGDNHALPYSPQTPAANAAAEQADAQLDDSALLPSASEPQTPQDSKADKCVLHGRVHSVFSSSEIMLTYHHAEMHLRHCKLNIRQQTCRMWRRARNWQLMCLLLHTLGKVLLTEAGYALSCMYTSCMYSMCILYIYVYITCTM